MTYLEKLQALLGIAPESYDPIMAPSYLENWACEKSHGYEIRHEHNRNDELLGPKILVLIDPYYNGGELDFVALKLGTTIWRQPLLKRWPHNTTRK